MLISIVCPFYNEEDGVALFFNKVAAVVDGLSGCEFEFVCVNDGSAVHFG